LRRALHDPDARLLRHDGNIALIGAAIVTLLELLLQLLEVH
jgi:hypothetical protein